jgi:hypothetical protein
MSSKICKKCGIEKELSEFYKKSNGKFGRQSICKICFKDLEHKRYLENKEKILKQKKEYYLNNKKEVLKQKSEYYNLNREFLLTNAKNYYYSHQEQIKNYREENKEHIAEITKKHRQERKEYYNNYKNTFDINRRKTDINFRIKCNLRTRLYNALKRNSKLSSTEQLLGCTVEEFKKYIESKFQPGMTWSNWGKGFGKKGKQEWHIDHIIPCVLFDLSNSEEQKECFHYSNLQPLWAKENLLKGKNYNGNLQATF